MPVSFSDGSHISRPALAAGASPADSVERPLTAGIVGLQPKFLRQEVGQEAPPVSDPAESPTSEARPRPAKRSMSPGELMVRLSALTQDAGTAAAEAQEVTVQALTRTKDRLAIAQAKKIKDLFDRLKAAARNWLAKLPGWISKFAGAIVTSLIAATLVASVMASGGIAAAPLLTTLAVSTSLAGVSGLVMSTGQIISDATGHEGEFSLSALDESAGWGGGGTALEGLLSGNPAQIIAGFAKSVGAEGDVLMAIELTATALMIGITGRAMYKSAAVPETIQRLAHSAKLAAGGFQVVQSAAQIGEGVVAGEMAKDQAAVTRARGQSELANANFQDLVQSLLEVIESAGKKIAPSLEVTRIVSRFIGADAKTSSHLMA